MNPKTHLAIQATKAGETQKAQYLLTQALQENPQETEAWYLLSLLVDSEEKQAAYLNQVLTLDPNHQRAQDRLAGLATAVSPTPAQLKETPVSAEAASADDSDADWMSDADFDDFFADSRDEDDTSAPEAEAAPLPDWLQEGSAPSAEESGQPETVVAAPQEDEETLISLAETIREEETREEEPATPATTKAPAQQTTKPPAKKKDSQLTLALAILVILAVLVGIFLIYLILTI